MNTHPIKTPPHIMLPKDIDETDVRILDYLQKNGRISNVDLAKAVHLSPSPCLARVKSLEARGYISRYVTLLDPILFGFTVSVFIAVRLEKQIESVLKSFEQAIHGRPEVMECYLMTGGSDYVLRVVVPNVQALEKFLVEFLSRVPGVSNMRSSFALKQVKYNTALPLPRPIERVRRRRRVR